MLSLTILTLMTVSLPQQKAEANLGKVVVGALEEEVGYQVQGVASGLIEGAFGGDPRDFMRKTVGGFFEDVFKRDGTSIASVESSQNIGAPDGALGLPDLEGAYDKVGTGEIESPESTASGSLLEGYEKSSITRAFNDAVAMGSLGQAGREQTESTLQNVGAAMQSSAGGAQSAASAPSTKRVVQQNAGLIATGNQLLGTVVANQKKQELMQASLLKVAGDTSRGIESMNRARNSTLNGESAALIKRSSSVQLR